MSNDRFDLEQAIMNCWGIVEDMKVLTEGVLEQDMSTDDIANITMGLEGLYQLKFEKLWNIFESLCAQGEFNKKYSETKGDNCNDYAAREEAGESCCKEQSVTTTAPITGVVDWIDPAFEIKIDPLKEAGLWGPENPSGYGPRNRE